MAQPFFRVQLEGYAELERALRELPKAAAKGVLRTAMRKAGQQVVDAASAAAPKDTGALAESLALSTRLTKGQRRRRRKKGDVELFLGPTYPSGAHGHLVEFGTAHMAKRPFLRPAWDGLVDNVLKDFGNAMWAAIEKAARRLAARKGW